MALRNSIKATVEVIENVTYAVLTVNDDNGVVFKTQIRCESQEEASNYCSKWRKNAEASKDAFLSSLM